MTACRRLAQRQGVDEATCLLIDRLHEEVEACMHAAILDGDVWAAEVLSNYDYKLQELWNFPRDSKYHTLVKKYLFKKQWYGKIFKCTKTGEKFTIPYEVYETACYFFGDAMVDVGRYNCYSRFSNCVEVTSEYN